ncbi:MAG: glycoside hydrolase family 5 protein [Candidatus Bathyarchaeota archaeon]|nr:glycoside hydrolase family 5 protein [Candidatus Bathyarchaeota archaeon]
MNLKASCICVLIIVGVLFFSGFLTTGSQLCDYNFPKTSTQGQMLTAENNSQLLVSDSATHIEGKSSSPGACDNSNGYQTTIDQNELQSESALETGSSVVTMRLKLGNETTHIAKGLNYLSAYHMYSNKSLSDAILERDFSRFRQDGIEVISLSLYWYRLEGHTRGSYDGVHPDKSPYGDTFLTNVKRVINIANQNGIKVLVTFHTLWGSDSPWCTPDYVIDPVTGNNTGIAIVRSDEMREAFVDMFTHTVSYLAGTPGIWAWAILNEPWYWPHELPAPFEDVDQKENFINLFQELSNVVKVLDGRPVTIRFVNTHIGTASDGVPRMKNIFVDDWGWDQRIFNTLDFISFNAYSPQQPNFEEIWLNITTTNVLGSFQRNKQVWITEFGSKADDETTQAKDFDKMLSLYVSLHISGCLAWLWSSSEAPDAISESNWNLCINYQTGIGKLAYQKLLSYEEEN